MAAPDSFMLDEGDEELPEGDLPPVEGEEAPELDARTAAVKAFWSSAKAGKWAEAADAFDEMMASAGGLGAEEDALAAEGASLPPDMPF